MTRYVQDWRNLLSHYFCLTCRLQSPRSVNVLNFSEGSVYEHIDEIRLIYDIKFIFSSASILSVAIIYVLFDKIFRLDYDN